MLHGDRYVLVIDDEEPVRETVSDILNYNGISTLVAASGYSGIDIFEQNQVKEDDQ